MAYNGDKTQKLLEHLLGELYKEQSTSTDKKGDSYLEAQDGQYLGKITTNKYENDSIINQYGPFGSKYSSTSIFNQYSQYGSKYGSYSINNQYCNQPPKLFIRGHFVGCISKNRFVTPRIDPEDFINKLKNDLSGLLTIRPGQQIEREFSRNDSYLLASDGTFIGKLTSNEFDSESILNQYGNYGSQYSGTSIFNKYGTYGSDYSSLSPYNEYTSNPPKIFINGQFWGYLTKNSYILGNRLDPEKIKQWIYDNQL